VEADLPERRREHDHRLRPERGAVATGLELAPRQLREAVRERGETPFMESIVAPGAVASGFPVDVITG
jgi:hypothetical protein